MTSHGVDSSASCLAATGRITSRREPAAQGPELPLLVAVSEVHPALRPGRRKCPAPPNVVSIDWSVNQHQSTPPSCGRCRFGRAATRPPGFRRRRYVHLVVADWRRRLAVIVGVLVVLGGVGVGAYFLVDSLRRRRRSSRHRRRASSSTSSRRRPTQDLGFPAFATKNTTRVAGADPVADAAGVALAVFPSTGGVPGPAAVTLVDDDDWARGSPRPASRRSPSAPRSCSRARTTIPDFTAEALSALAPAGSAKTDGKQIFAIGSATAPHDLETRRVTGSTPGRDRRRDRPAAPEADRRQAGAHRAGELRRSRRTRCRPPPGRRARAIRCCSSSKDAAPKPTLAGASARRGRPGLRARAQLGDLGQGARAGAEGRPGRAAGRRRGSRGERDRLRALCERQLRLEHQRPRARIRDRERRPAAGRRGRRAAVGQRRLGARCWSPTTRGRSPPRCAATCSTSSPATWTTRPAPSTTTSG